MRCATAEFWCIFRLSLIQAGDLPPLMHPTSATDLISAPVSDLPLSAGRAPRSSRLIAAQRRIAVALREESIPLRMISEITGLSVPTICAATRAERLRTEAVIQGAGHHEAGSGRLGHTRFKLVRATIMQGGPEAGGMTDLLWSRNAVSRHCLSKFGVMIESAALRRLLWRCNLRPPKPITQSTELLPPSAQSWVKANLKALRRQAKQTDSELWWGGIFAARTGEPLREEHFHARGPLIVFAARAIGDFLWLGAGEQAPAALLQDFLQRLDRMSHTTRMLCLPQSLAALTPPSKTEQTGNINLHWVPLPAVLSVNS